MRFTCLCCDFVKLASNRRALNSISDRYLFVFDIAAVMIIQRTRFQFKSNEIRLPPLLHSCGMKEQFSSIVFVLESICRKSVVGYFRSVFRGHRCSKRIGTTLRTIDFGNDWGPTPPLPIPA